MGAAFAFPGTKGLQAEFPRLVPRIRGVWIDERFASAGMLTLTALGYGLNDMRDAAASPRGPPGRPLRTSELTVMSPCA